MNPFGQFPKIPPTKIRTMKEVVFCFRNSMLTEVVEMALNVSYIELAGKNNISKRPSSTLKYGK